MLYASKYFIYIFKIHTETNLTLIENILKNIDMQTFFNHADKTQIAVVYSYIGKMVLGIG